MKLIPIMITEDIQNLHSYQYMSNAHVFICIYVYIYTFIYFNLNHFTQIFDEAMENVPCEIMLLLLGNFPSDPARSSLQNYRVLRSPSLVAVGLSEAYETWLVSPSCDWLV